MPGHPIRPKAFDSFHKALSETIRYAGFALTFEVTRRAEVTEGEIQVRFHGKDVPLLLEHRGELLLALEHLGAKALRLEPEEHDRVSFDAAEFKAERDRRLALAASEAIQQVRRTRRPYRFPPMSSRERRILHLALTEAGMLTHSEGEGSRRHLVLSLPRANQAQLAGD